MDPHPLDGLRLKLTPAFFESCVTVAVMVIPAEPASTVEAGEDSATLMLLELPQPHSIRSKTHDARNTAPADTACIAGARRCTETHLLAMMISLLLISLILWDFTEDSVEREQSASRLTAHFIAGGRLQYLRPREPTIGLLPAVACGSARRQSRRWVQVEEPALPLQPGVLCPPALQRDRSWPA